MNDRADATLSDNLPALPDVSGLLATTDDVRDLADLKRLSELLRDVARTRKGKEREAFRGAMGALRCFRKIGQLLMACPRESPGPSPGDNPPLGSQLHSMIELSGLSESHAFRAMDTARITDQAMDEFEARCDGERQRAHLLEYERGKCVTVTHNVPRLPPPFLQKTPAASPRPRRGRPG